MKGIVSALAVAALAVTPLAAAAQGHGGMGRGGFSHGGFSHTDSFRGTAGFRGADSFHGFRGGGFRHAFFPFFGFGLGFALADPWFWPGYYGWDYPPPYGYYGYGGPPAGGAPPPTACGSWVWHGDQQRYQWVAAPCQNTAPPPADH